MSVATILERFIQQEGKRKTLAAVHCQEAREAVYGEWPGGLSEGLRQTLRDRGIERLYRHQSEAIDSILSGQDVVVVTPTASGKTLCYNLPVLQAVGEDEGARALYLFPTKALSQDQLAELLEFSKQKGTAKLNLGVFTYDGDTPSDARRAVRSRAHVVITNPDMLHTGILPHHTKWARFFANLRYIVVDELHTYRGVFGSHLANVLRRLERICRFHGSRPTYVLCSATIANPKELADRLTERDVRLIDKSGAPSGKRTLVFYNPPVLNKELGIRRSYITASRRIASMFLKESIKTIVFAASRLNVEVLTRYLKDRFERHESEVGRIRGYRGGYLPSARREIERGLRDGSVQGVVSTNALELGIDIGSLDVAILAGYPGTVASTWQQAGRAGRRQGEAAVVMVGRSDPLDQFLMQNPDFFFGASPERALINPDNLAILMSHLKCAAFELPIMIDEKLGSTNVGEMAAYLAEKGVLHRSGDEYHWTQEVYPADTISLRSASPENFVIMDMDQNNRVIAECDWHAAPSTVYEDAIYMCEAKTYNVKKLDYAQRRAYVRAVEVDYYTDAITSTSVKVLEGFQSEKHDHLVREHGEVHVSWRVSGFKKIKFYSRENVGFGEVHLPDHEMHTTSFWLTFREDMLHALKYTRSQILEGVVGLAYCLHHLAPVYLMCDLRDLDRCVGDRSGEWFARPDETGQGRYTTQIAEKPENEALAESWMRISENPITTMAPEKLTRFDPTIFLYDNYPAGMGFSANLYDLCQDLLTRAVVQLERCECSEGCPACVGPPQEMGEIAREAQRRLSPTLTAVA